MTLIDNNNQKHFFEVINMKEEVVKEGVRLLYFTYAEVGNPENQFTQKVFEFAPGYLDREMC